MDDLAHLEAISECLDTTVAGVGNYRVVAQSYGLSHYQICSVLQKADGGPTTALIECLAVSCPTLTVQEFAAVVGQKANRKDVVALLKAYDSSKLDSVTDAGKRLKL